jgi:hypothetical protein
MSTSHPPRRYFRIVTLIAVYASGDGARFWRSQCSRSSARKSTRPNADDARQLATSDHRVDRAPCRSQQRRCFIDGQQHRKQVASATRKRAPITQVARAVVDTELHDAPPDVDESRAGSGAVTLSQSENRLDRLIRERVAARMSNQGDVKRRESNRDLRSAICSDSHRAMRIGLHQQPAETA